MRLTRKTVATINTKACYTQGLGLLESLGAALGVPTPVCSSLIEIASAALGCNLRAQGRTIERLGRDNIRTILDDAERGAEPCPAGTH